MKINTAWNKKKNRVYQIVKYWSRDIQISLTSSVITQVRIQQNSDKSPLMTKKRVWPYPIDQNVGK